MQEQLDKLRETVTSRIEAALDEGALAEARTRVLGRKGELTGFLRSLKDLAPEERARMGKQANVLKAELEKRFDEALEALRAKAEQEKLQSEFIDVTLPGRRSIPGRTHILHRVKEDIVDISPAWAFNSLKGPKWSWITTTSRR